jgi:hypothetical protein
MVRAVWSRLSRDAFAHRRGTCGIALSGAISKHTEPVIHGDPEIMGGTLVFVGTRVPLETLLD